MMANRSLTRFVPPAALDSQAAPAWAARLLHRHLRGLQGGSLTLRDGGARHDFGSGEPRVEVRIHDVACYRRMLLGGALGAGESYIDGQWDCDDLVGLMRLLLLNRPALSRLDGALTGLRRILDRLGHRRRRNSRAGSRRNIEAHYDLSNPFFQTFLDRRMMYSSAVYERSDMSLDAASDAKLERLCRKLELGPDDHLLEIGTGWGGLAVYAAQQFGCRVTTATLSPAQHQVACERVRAAGLEDRVDVRLCDYRELDGVYDKLVSVEMVEAVGHQYLDQYFEIVGRLVRPGGLIAIQAITIEDGRYLDALHRVDFIKKHVFPGSFIPSVSALVTAAAANSDTVLVNLEDIGADYATTLAAWRQRVEQAGGEHRAQGLSPEFLRLWRFYLCYCEAGFRERSISDVHLLFARSGYRGRPWRAALGGSSPARTDEAPS